MIIKDAHEDIMFAQLGKLLGTYSSKVLNKNGDGKSLLMCSGLSTLVNRYEKKLNPYYGDTSYDNYDFNPKEAINEILIQLKSNKELFGLFVNEFLSRINLIEQADVEKFNNILAVLGYKLNVEEVYDFYSEKYKYSLTAYSEGTSEREKEITYLTSKLVEQDSGLLKYYTEAISTYGHCEYKSCIANCRTLFESLFSKYDEQGGKIQKGIINFTGEQAKPGKSCKLTQQKIFDYWLENNEGFNKYRLLSTMYSFMSAFEHGEEIANKEDALFCLRMLEDILIWYYSEI